MNELDADLRRFSARRMMRGALIVSAAIVLVPITASTLHGHPSRVTTGAFGGTFVTGDTRIHVGTQLEGALEGTSVAMLFVAFVLGATFIGADFNAGSLSTQLLFVPARWRVHASKATAVAAGTGVLTFAVLVLLAAAMYAGSEIHGIVGGIDLAWWLHRAAAVLRGSAVAAIGGVLAYSVALTGRKSAAGIIVFFVQYPLLFLIAPESQPFGFVSRFEPLRSLLVVLINPARSAVTGEGIRTTAGALVVTAIWVIVIMGLAGRVFARAEVR